MTGTESQVQQCREGGGSSPALRENRKAARKVAAAFSLWFNPGRYSPAAKLLILWWALKDLNLRPFGCKPNALTAELSAPTDSSYRKRHEASTHRACWNFERFGVALHFRGPASKLLLLSW